MIEMDFHQTLKIAGGLLALLLFIPLIAEILKRGPAGQSCATWLLWGTLDIIVAVSIIQQHGNFLLPLGFAIGDAALVLLLLIKGRFEWDKFETVILILVIGCLLAWKFGGDRTATIAATIGICVAGIPGWKALRKNPQRKIGNIWAGYVVANLLSFFGGTAMTVEERFAPGVFALCSLAMFMASRGKIKQD
ncbi:MAG: hypothetical protein QOD03_308 [Verrucomicrobiota bacterium]